MPKKPKGKEWEPSDKACEAAMDVIEHEIDCGCGCMNLDYDSVANALKAAWKVDHAKD